MKISIPQPSQSHFVAVPFQSALAVVVDRFKLTFIGGRHAVAFAQVPVETAARANRTLLELLDATDEMERRFKHREDQPTSRAAFFFFGKLAIEVKDTAVRLWTGPRIALTVPTRSREEVTDVIAGFRAVVYACEAMDEVRLINQIVARARAAQTSA